MKLLMTHLLMIFEVYWQRKIGDYHWGCCWFHSWYWKCEETVGEETALEYWDWANRKRWREYLQLGCWPCHSQSHFPALQHWSVHLAGDSSSFFYKLVELCILKVVGHSTKLKGKKTITLSPLHEFGQHELRVESYLLFSRCKYRQCPLVYSNPLKVPLHTWHQSIEVYFRYSVTKRQILNIIQNVFKSIFTSYFKRYLKLCHQI